MNIVIEYKFPIPITIPVSVKQSQWTSAQ